MSGGCFCAATAKQPAERTCLERRNLGSVSRSSMAVMERCAAAKSVRVGLSIPALISRTSALSMLTCNLALPAMYLR